MAAGDLIGAIVWRWCRNNQCDGQHPIHDSQSRERQCSARSRLGIDIFAQVAGQRRERRLVAELCAGLYAVCAGKGRLARRKRLRMGVEEATKGAQDGREVA